MGKYFIYNARLEDKKHPNVTVVFNPDVDYEYSQLRKELTDYFRFFHQTSALLFFYCKTKENAKNEIEENLDLLFKSIPKVEEKSLKGNM